jgi:hypothetical protein
LVDEVVGDLAGDVALAGAHAVELGQPLLGGPLPSELGGLMAVPADQGDAPQAMVGWPSPGCAGDGRSTRGGGPPGHPTAERRPARCPAAPGCRRQAPAAARRCPGQCRAGPTALVRPCCPGPPPHGRGRRRGAAKDPAGLVDDRRHLAVGMGVDPTVTGAVGLAGRPRPFLPPGSGRDGAPRPRRRTAPPPGALPRLRSGHSPDR